MDSGKTRELFNGFLFNTTPTVYLQARTREEKIIIWQLLSRARDDREDGAPDRQTDTSSLTDTLPPDHIIVEVLQVLLHKMETGGKQEAEIRGGSNDDVSAGHLRVVDRREAGDSHAVIPAAWPSPAQVLQEWLNLEPTQTRIIELRRFYEEQLTDPERLEKTNDDKTKPIGQVIRYGRKLPTSYPTFYIDPAAKKLVLQGFKPSRTDIPDTWLSCTKVLEAMSLHASEENIHRLDLYYDTLIGGKNLDRLSDGPVKVDDFLRYGCRGTNYSYYLHPDELNFVRKDLGIAPMMPTDGIVRVNTDQMTRRLYGSAKYVNQVKELVRTCLKERADEIDPHTGLTLGELMGEFRSAKGGGGRGRTGRMGEGSLYFREEAEQFLRTELKIATRLDQRFDEYLSVGQVIRNFGLDFKRGWAQLALDGMIKRWRKEHPDNPAETPLIVYGKKRTVTDYYFSPKLLEDGQPFCCDAIMELMQRLESTPVEKLFRPATEEAITSRTK